MRMTIILTCDVSESSEWVAKLRSGAGSGGCGGHLVDGVRCFEGDFQYGTEGRLSNVGRGRGGECRPVG